MPRTKAAGRKAKQKKAPKPDEPSGSVPPAISDDLPQDPAAASPAVAESEGSKHSSGEKRKIGSALAGEGSEEPKLPPAQPESQEADGETPGWPSDEPLTEESQPKKKRKKTRSKMKNLKKDNRDEGQKPKYYKEGWNQQLQRSKHSSGNAKNEHKSFF